MNDNPVSKKQIREELWRRGELSWKFHEIQKEMWEIFQKAEPRSVMVWLLSRQTGKSFFIGILACIQAMKKNYSRNIFGLQFLRTIF